MAQAVIHLGRTPYDPSLGEGNYERVEAAFYLWFSLGTGIVLLAYAHYLAKRER